MKRRALGTSRMLGSDPLSEKIVSFGRDPGLLYGLLVIVLGLLGWHVLSFDFDHLVDDAYITFRYADNLIRGEGLVFNAGERVEGYTNFLWVIVLAGLMYVGAEPVVTAKILGGLICLATALQTFRIAVILGGRNLFALIPPLFLAVNAGYVLWASGGLETHLFALLIATGALSYLRQGGARRQAQTAVFFALATLTRPEGALFAGVTILHAVVYGWRKPAGRRNILALAATYAGLLLPYLAFKLVYYGDLLPNTFYAKAPSGTASLSVGAGYLGQFFSTSFHPLLLLLLGYLVYQRAREAWFTYLAASIVSFSSYVLWVGGDSFPCFRFMVPVVPLLAVLAGASFQTTLVGLTRAAWFRNPLTLSLVLAGTLAWALIHALTSPIEGSQAKAMVPDYEQADRDRLAIADWFERRLPPDTSIALNAAGIIPYYTRFPTIDMLGLNDRHISHTTSDSIGSVGHLKFDPDYIIDRRPDLIIIGAGKLLDGEVETSKVVEYCNFVAARIPGDRALLLHRRILVDYTLVAAKISDGKFLPFFLSNESRIRLSDEPDLVVVPPPDA